MDEGRQRGTIPAWAGEHSHSGSRLSGLAVGTSLSPSRGTSPATGLPADRLSRTWPFSRPAGPSSAADSRSGYGGPGSRFGPLLTAAGFAWFLPEWNNPGDRLVARLHGRPVPVRRMPSARRTRGARVSRRPARLARSSAVAVRVAYAGGVLVLGVLPALVYDPQAQGLQSVSQQPPSDLGPRRARGPTSTGSALYLAGRLGVGARGSCAREARTSVRVGGEPSSRPAPCYLGLVAAWFASSLDRGALANGDAASDVSGSPQAAALVVLAARSRMELGSEPQGPVGRRAARRRARPVASTGRPEGRSRRIGRRSRPRPRLPAGRDKPTGRCAGLPGRATRGGPGNRRSSREMGVSWPCWVTSRGLLADEQLVDDVAAAARLALENERLQADVRARLEELRASRARVVEAGDAERKRLERDLHDGAQQRLVGTLAVAAPRALEAGDTCASRQP